MLGGIDCASEHGEIVAEAVGVAGVNSGLNLPRGMMLGVSPVGADLSGIHQGFTDWQLRHPVVLSGLVDKPDHLLPYLQTVPRPPTLLDAMISAVPPDLATATQKVGTCSTAIMSGSLEVTV